MTCTFLVLIVFYKVFIIMLLTNIFITSLSSIIYGFYQVTVILNKWCKGNCFIVKSKEVESIVVRNYF